MFAQVTQLESFISNDLEACAGNKILTISSTRYHFFLLQSELRRKESAQLRQQMARHAEEGKSEREADCNALRERMDRLENDSGAAFKRERSERERLENVVRERLETDQKELRACLDRDR